MPSIHKTAAHNGGAYVRTLAGWSIRYTVVASIPPTTKEFPMNRKHVAQQTQRERNCSPSNGTERLTSSRIARVGVSALIAGQLMMPGISLAAEDTDQNVVQANSTATVAAEEAAPAPTASNDATNGTKHRRPQPKQARSPQRHQRHNPLRRQTPRKLTHPRRLRQKRLRLRQAIKTKRRQPLRRLHLQQIMQCQQTPSRPAA